MFRKLEGHDWNFWMWWVLLTAFTSTICFVIISLAFVWLNLPFAENNGGIEPTFLDKILGSLFFALAGMALAGGQWLALRIIFPRSAWWILAGGAGWLVGYWSYLLVFEYAAGLLQPVLAQFLPWFIIGLWGGLFQWLVLRPRYPRADSWLPVSTLALLIGSIGWTVGSICGGTFSWAVAGAIGGYALLRLEANRISG
jgi:hypothetical protein